MVIDWQTGGLTEEKTFLGAALFGGLAPPQNIACLPEGRNQEGLLFWGKENARGSGNGAIEMIKLKPREVHKIANRLSRLRQYYNENRFRCGLHWETVEVVIDDRGIVSIEYYENQGEPHLTCVPVSEFVLRLEGKKDGESVQSTMV